MRIAFAFFCVIGGAILWLFPITQAVYDFRTDPRTDSFTVSTAPADTTSTNTLLQAIYNNDTGTISYTSNVSEVPYVYSYNTTSRELVTYGLADNTTRLLNVTYDIDALSSSAALSTLMTWWPFIYYLIATAFPIAGVVAVITHRA